MGEQNRIGQDLIICLGFSITRRAARAIWKRGNKAWGRKYFWQWKVWTHCEFQCHHGDLSVKGETGSVKGETKSANFWQGKVWAHRQLCEFLARESVNSSSILARQWWRHFRLSLSLSLSLSPKVPHAQYRKRFRASYNKTVRDTGDPFPFRGTCPLLLRDMQINCDWWAWTWSVCDVTCGHEHEGQKTESWRSWTDLWHVSYTTSSAQTLQGWIRWHCNWVSSCPWTKSKLGKATIYIESRFNIKHSQ